MTTLNNQNLIKLIFSGYGVKALNDKLKQAKNSLISESILSIMNYKMIFKQIGHSNYTLNESTTSHCPIIELSNGNLLTVDKDKLKIWNINYYKCIKRSSEKNAYMIMSIALLPDGNIIGCTDDRKIKIWELGEIIRCVKTMYINNYGYMDLQYLLLLPNGNIACTADYNDGDGPCILILDPYMDCKCVRVLNGASASEECLTLLTNSFASTSDMVINIWDINNDYKCIKKLSGHTHYIDCLLYIDRYNLLISGSRDGGIKVWDIIFYVCVKSLNAHIKGVTCLLKLNGGHFATGSSDNIIKIWSINGNNPINVLQGHNRRVTSLVLLKNKKIVSTDDKQIIIWDC
jgi:WD40 repeat protein